MNNDPVADALIRIKNGYKVGKAFVNVRFSKMIMHMMKLLQKEGYIEDVAEEGRALKVTLKYTARKPVLSDIKRVSKPSLRVYKSSKELPVVLNGLGIAIISTPQGIMSAKEAKKLKIGGEVLALVW